MDPQFKILHEWGIFLTTFCQPGYGHIHITSIIMVIQGEKCPKLLLVQIQMGSQYHTHSSSRIYRRVRGHQKRKTDWTGKNVSHKTQRKYTCVLYVTLEIYKVVCTSCERQHWIIQSVRIFRQTCGHTPPNMGLAGRCMHHVIVIHLTHCNHYMAHLHIICIGCLLQLTDVLFNWMGPTNLVRQ